MRELVKTTAVVAAAALLYPMDAAAQGTKAGTVTTLLGSATVARASAPEPAPLRFKDDVFVQDRIVTGDSSTVRILLGGKAVITVRERSTLTISETPTTSTVEVGTGRIALAVAKERMKPGESVEIKTPNAVAGVRGTVVIAEVTAPADGGAATSRFSLLTGIVDVRMLDARTGQPSGPAVTLRPLQHVGVTSQLGSVRPISRGEARSIASDYKVSVPTPPAAANTHVTERQIDQAVKHTATLTGVGRSGKNRRGDDDTALASDNGNGPKDDTARVTTGGSRGPGGASGGGTVLGSTGSGSTGGGSIGGGSIGGGSIGGSIGGAIGGTIGGTIGGGPIGGTSGGSTGSGPVTGAVTGGITSVAGNNGILGSLPRLGGDDLRRRSGEGGKKKHRD